MAHGHFLWFRHEGKSYIVDDPAIVAQIEAMNKPMDELGDQMRALGEQMRDLGSSSGRWASRCAKSPFPLPTSPKRWPT